MEIIQNRLTRNSSATWKTTMMLVFLVLVGIYMYSSKPSSDTLITPVKPPTKHRKVAILSSGFFYGCIADVQNYVLQNHRTYAQAHGYDYITDPQLFEFEYQEVRGVDLFVTQPTTDKMINAGAFIVRNCTLMQEFFEIVDRDNKSYQTRWAEQESMWNLLRTAPFNSRVHNSRLNHDFNTLCGWHDGLCLWEPGDLMVHFAPPACPRKAELVIEFLQSGYALPKLYKPLNVD